MQAQKIIKITKLLELKCLTKLLDKGIEETYIILSEDNVINIEKVIDQNLAMSEDEEGRVSKGSMKTQVKQLSVKPLKPGTKGLL